MTVIQRRLCVLVCAVDLVVALATGATAQPKGKGQVAIVGGMLIDGHGGLPIHHSVVLVENDVIKAIGTEDNLKIPPGARVIDARGKTVMAGLIDLHCHVDIVGHGVYGDWHPIVKGRYKDVLPAESKTLLLAGVTMAREPGGFLDTDLWVRDSINRGDFPGPRRLVSGPYISFGDPAKGDSGPHGDPHSANAHYLMVNTPETAREAAIYLLDRGVDLLKAYDGLSEEMVRAIAEEAHKRGRHVASHVAGAADLTARIRAGIDSVEHIGSSRSGATGSHYTTEILDLLATRRTPVIPTLNVGLAYQETEEFPERIDDPRTLTWFPSDVQDLIRASNRNFSHLRYFDVKKGDNANVPHLFRQLLDAGATLLMGTEAGTPLNFHSSAAAREMVWMNKLGMDPMKVIIASTRGPAQFLRMEDKYGSIETGKVADIIAVDGNPLFNMSVMHQVSFVMKDGVIYKGDAPSAPSRSNPAGR